MQCTHTFNVMCAVLLRINETFNHDYTIQTVGVFFMAHSVYNYACDLTQLPPIRGCALALAKQATDNMQNILKN